MGERTGGAGSSPDRAGLPVQDSGTRRGEPVDPPGGSAAGRGEPGEQPPGRQPPEQEAEFDAGGAGSRGSFLAGQSAALAMLALAVLVVTGMAVLGLIRSRRGATGAAPSEWRGLVLQDPLEKAEFTLTDTEGRPFRFREETDGYVTLLFFGYTHCPDVCPLHMANLAAVLRHLADGVRSRVKVVFVTTDPERDTLERIRQWLGAFDPSFIGLWGPLERVNEIQAAFRLPPAVKQEVPGGEYLVGHAAYVIAFTADNRAHVLYPSGTRQADWAHDLPRLVQRGADWS